MSLQRHVDYFSRKSTVIKGGGDKAIGKQKASGKMTARERIAALLDEGSFNEYDMFVEHKCQDFGMGDKELAADGVVTGSGTIAGRPVCIYAQDFTVAGGSLGLMHARKITKVMDHAIKMGVPIIGINSSLPEERGFSAAVRIDDSLMVPGEADILGDLIQAAHADAKRRLDEINNALMREAAGPMAGMNIPGMPKLF